MKFREWKGDIWGESGSFKKTRLKKNKLAVAEIIVTHTVLYRLSPKGIPRESKQAFLLSGECYRQNLYVVSGTQSQLILTVQAAIIIIDALILF